MRLWGGRTMDDILTVDPEGMITIPDVGRVPVAGLPIDAKEPLEQAIKSKLNAAGVVDVEMYIRPMDTQPVSIFVTGFVPRPGNYTGTPSDTILAFLDKAGGIDSKRGSYRNIRVLRQGQEVGSFDLYPFALKGAMPHIRFQDGDTVVVGEKGPSVITSGEVRNTARFEFKPGELTGAKLIELADPQPRATHVSLSGSRGGAPYNLYLPMNDFKALRLENGDQIRFLADRPGDTIMVEAQGAIRGASRFPVRRNTRLHEVMSYIAVEPGRANLEGLYIKRKSVAVRQKKAIEDALRRLEQNAYTATSASSDEAQIRSKEAEMLSNFISRAKEVQPEGVVVVGTKGNIADLALEDGDVIVIPEKTDVVLISGEVMMPQAIVWNKDKDMDDYIKGAGGFSNRADESNLIVVHPSGEVVPRAKEVLPGDQVLVLPRVESKNLQAVKDISRELIALYAKRKASKGFAFSPDTYLQQELEASFMWEDTPDQQTATQAVKRDMESNQPMDRLICGDVGFGKTEVAIRAAFKAATDGKQVAVLVPTTILALQHYRSFVHRLRDFPVKVEYLNRTKSSKETSRILSELAEGRIDILIGTHKILGKQVKFHDLGLLIIDEEQKFGVAAKEKLTQMSVNVDTLTLTATPIPRTLQFSLMGSRDLSVISTPPPNRQPIITESHLFSEEIIRDAVNAELDRGGQVYFVHNRVEDLMTLQGMVTRLCPRARVGIGHGKMPAEQLEKLIMDFIYGEFDVLISTTIVENGIDIPNANTIIVNNAQNFGLSDLHQLRGRVGRGSQRGYCYLLSPGDELLTPDARRRLRAIEEFSDLGSGFNIAMQDLDIRGAGNLLGAEQSGFIADIGFETYQKIMQEAIAELRSEGLEMPGMSDAEQGVVDKMSYISDSVIEIDVEAELPDSYVQQPAEKLRLYRELDTARNEEMLKSFEAKMIDRFGPLPRPAAELLNVVRLRWEAVRLGMERVKVKNGLMIVHFVGDDDSPYYKSDTFMELLRKVTQRPDRFVLKQHNNRLAMTVRGIKDVAAGYEVLKSL